MSVPIPIPIPTLVFVDFAWFENLVGEVPTPVPSLLFFLSFDFNFFELKPRQTEFRQSNDPIPTEKYFLRRKNPKVSESSAHQIGVSRSCDSIRWLLP